MKTIKRIIFDVDNTIAPSDTAFIRAAEVIYGRKPLSYTAKKWNFADVLPNFDSTRIVPTFASDEFFSFLKPFDYVVEEITKCHDMGVRIAFCSHCNPWSIGKKAIWLSGLFDFKFEMFLTCKWGMDKSWCSMGNGDLFIDDHPICLNSTDAEFKLMFQNVNGRDWQQEWNGMRLENWESFSKVVKAINTSNEVLLNEYTSQEFLKDASNCIIKGF